MLRQDLADRLAAKRNAEQERDQALADEDQGRAAELNQQVKELATEAGEVAGQLADHPAADDQDMVTAISAQIETSISLERSGGAPAGDAAGAEAEEQLAGSQGTEASGEGGQAEQGQQEQGEGTQADTQADTQTDNRAELSLGAGAAGSHTATDDQAEGGELEDTKTAVPQAGGIVTGGGGFAPGTTTSIGTGQPPAGTGTGAPEIVIGPAIAGGIELLSRTPDRPGILPGGPAKPNLGPLQDIFVQDSLPPFTQQVTMPDGLLKQQEVFGAPDPLPTHTGTGAGAEAGLTGMGAGASTTIFEPPPSIDLPDLRGLPGWNSTAG